MHPQQGMDQLPEHFDDMNLERNNKQVSRGAEMNPNIFNKEPGGLAGNPQGHQGQQANSPSSRIVGPSQTLGVGSQTLDAGHGYLPTPIVPPSGRSPSHPSPHSSLVNHCLDPKTPTRSGSSYLEHISPLRFPTGQPSSRRPSFQSMSNFAHSNMDNTAEGSGGVSDSSGAEDNGGVSTTVGFQNTGGASDSSGTEDSGGVSTTVGFHNIGGASMSVNSQINEGASMHNTSQDIGVANMNDTTQSNAGAVMNVAPDGGQAAPRNIPSQVQLPANRQHATSQRYGSHRTPGGNGLRRMNSTPVMVSRPMFNPSPGVGSVHIPSHPVPTAPTLSAAAVDPANDEANGFFNTL